MPPSAEWAPGTVSRRGDLCRARQVISSRVICHTHPANNKESPLSNESRATLLHYRALSCGEERRSVNTPRDRDTVPHDQPSKAAEEPGWSPLAHPRGSILKRQSLIITSPPPRVPAAEQQRGSARSFVHNTVFGFPAHVLRKKHVPLSPQSQRGEQRSFHGNSWARLSRD